MSRQFETIGPGGVSALAPPHSDYVNVYSMDGATAQTVTWPSWATFCNINAGANYWIRTGGTAVVPAGALTDGTGSALNPAQRRRYQNEASFSIISSTVQYITIEFWGA